MADLEVLDRERHARLRLGKPTPPAQSFVQIVPDEIAEAAARAPLFFTKDSSTGQFYVGAMFGFKEGENLLQDSMGRVSGFVPLDVIRQGFFISGEHIAIDPADPRFTSGEGEPLFQDDGQPSDRLRQIQYALGRAHRGIEESRRFIAAMMKLRLIEPVDISLRFDDGETVTLLGLYTISLDALQELDDAQALALFRNGDLQMAFAIAQSLRLVPALAEQRNRRLGDLTAA